MSFDVLSGCDWIRVHVIVTGWTYVLSLVCFTSVSKVSGLELHLRKLRRNFFEMGNLTQCRQFDRNGDLLVVQEKVKTPVCCHWVDCYLVALYCLQSLLIALSSSSLSQGPAVDIDSQGCTSVVLSRAATGSPTVLFVRVQPLNDYQKQVDYNFTASFWLRCMSILSTHLYVTERKVT